MAGVFDVMEPTSPAASSTSAAVYPALIKDCFALTRVWPLFNAFFIPPEISCALEVSTILIFLHLALNDKFCGVCSLILL